MADDIKNLISAKELYSQYDWFQNTFSPILQEAGDDFFTQLFDIKFIALSKNFNCLQNNESCFVTKVKIDKEYDLFLRLNDKAVQIILDRILGKGKNKFDINRISELEAKIITSFNSQVYENLKPMLVAANPKELRRSNFDIVHLTFLLKDLDESVTQTGKIFVSLPAALLAPEQIQAGRPKFSKEDFKDCPNNNLLVAFNSSVDAFNLSNESILSKIALVSPSLNFISCLKKSSVIAPVSL